MAVFADRLAIHRNEHNGNQYKIIFDNQIYFHLIIGSYTCTCNYFTVAETKYGIPSLKVMYYLLY